MLSGDSVRRENYQLFTILAQFIEYEDAVCK